jgi:Domain of unknown function (DUF4258)
MPRPRLSGHARGRMAQQKLTEEDVYWILDNGQRDRSRWSGWKYTGYLPLDGKVEVCTTLDDTVVKTVIRLERRGKRR